MIREYGRSAQLNLAQKEQGRLLCVAISLLSSWIVHSEPFFILIF
jgi:hypothetical protein